MKNKAFTLIELLAVIVILAIIALIATPIVLGIINDARENAKKRSSELVYTGVEYAYTTALFKEGNGNVVDDVSLETIDKYLKIENIADHGFATTDTTKSELHIQTKDNVYCKVEKDIIKKAFKVNCGTDSDYTKNNIIKSKMISYDIGKICALKSGVSQKIGSEYTCSLDTDRTFYVLEDGDNTTLKKGTTGTAGPGEISLILNMNYIDGDGSNGTVPLEMKWCVSSLDNSCNHDNLDPMIEHIQRVFGSDVVVNLPSYNQIYNVNRSITLVSWLYINLNNNQGYWTSSPDKGFSVMIEGDPSSRGYPNASCVKGQTLVSTPVSSVGIGIRPVITLSKTLLD